MLPASPDREWLRRAAGSGGGGNPEERARVRRALGAHLVASWDWVAERRVTAEFWRRAARCVPAGPLAEDMRYLARPARTDRLRQPSPGGLAVGRIPALLEPAEDDVPEWLCSIFSMREADLAVCAAVCVLRPEGGERALRKMKHDMSRPLWLLASRVKIEYGDDSLLTLFPVGEQWWS